MKVATLLIAVLSISLMHQAHAEKLKLGDDKFLNISLLIQPQFAAAQRAAPNGDVGTDLFLRRGRLILSGQYDPRISFVFITDQPNWGKNGDFSSTFIIQDALARSHDLPGRAQLLAGQTYVQSEGRAGDSAPGTGRRRPGRAE